MDGNVWHFEREIKSLLFEDGDAGEDGGVSVLTGCVVFRGG
jgi:hypothetical protein